MIAIVEQTLCNVHSCYACALIPQSVKYEFVLAYSIDRQFVEVFQLLFYIIGIERSKRTDVFDVLTSQSQDVDIRTQCHKEIAVECAYLSERSGWRLFCRKRFGCSYMWRRQELLHTFTHTYRARAWSAAAMWR